MGLFKKELIELKELAEVKGEDTPSPTAAAGVRRQQQAHFKQAKGYGGMNSLSSFLIGLVGLVEGSAWAATLAKITVWLALAWTVHLALRRVNPRWRVLLWRGAAVGAIAIPLAIVLLPRLEIGVTVRKASLSRKPAEIAGERPTGLPPSPVAWINSTTVGPPGKTTGSDHPAFQAPVGKQPQPVSSSVPLAVRASSLDCRRMLPLLALVLWLAGIAAGALRLWVGFRKVRRFVNSSRPAPAFLAAACERVSRDLGCRSQVEARVTDDLDSPFIAGFRRPRLLVPRALCDSPHEGDLPGIIAHEVFHLNSGDLLWNLIVQIVSVGLWFHPLVWRMGAAHASACEEVCDAAAAGFVGDPRAYSRTLARVAVEMASCPPTVAGIPMARVSDLSRRLGALKRKVFSAPLAHRYVVLFAFAGIVSIALLGCMHLVRREAKPPAAARLGAGAPAPLEVVNEPLGQGKAVLAARREGIGTLTCGASGRFGGAWFGKERIVVGTDTGIVAMLSEEGKQLWRRQCSQEIQGLGLLDKRIFVRDADGIAAFDGKGRELWRRNVPDLQAMAVSPQRLGDGLIATITPQGLELIAPGGKTRARVESATLPGESRSWQQARRSPLLPGPGWKTLCAAVVGDVNGDGRCEVAACSYQAVFLFDRQGELLWSKVGLEYDIYNREAQIWYPTMAVSDLNADGKDELLIATNRGIMALDAEGAKIWSTPTNYGNIRCLAEGDMDGDGKKEIAVGSTSFDLHVYGSDGVHRWTAPIGSWTSAVAMADLDQDGKDEVLAAGQFQAPDVLAFDAAGKVKWRCPMTFDVRCLAPVGLGRGKCRGIAACGGDLRFLDPAGNLRWTFFSGGPHKVAVADLDGDGAAEILDGATALTAYDGGGDLLWTRQTGTVWDLAALGAGAGREPRIAVGYERQAADLFSGDGSVLWQQKLGWIRSSVLFDDVDADGSAEVVVADNQTVYLYGRDGKERWKFEDRDENGTYWMYCAATANLNGDRDRQILVGSYVGVHALGADGWRLWDYTEPNTDNSRNRDKFALIRPNSIAAADLNGDGREEVVVTAHSGLYCFSAEGKVLWLDRSFRIAGNPRDGVHLVHCADLTGDGIPEIIVGQNVVAVLDASGKIVWSKKPDLSVADLAVGDVDGDGRVEIIAAGKELCVFAGDGTEKLRYAGSARFRRVALGDVDGDGVNEIIVGGAGVYVFKMTGPLFEVPRVPGKAAPKKGVPNREEAAPKPLSAVGKTQAPVPVGSPLSRGQNPSKYPMSPGVYLSDGTIIEGKVFMYLEGKTDGEWERFDWAGGNKVLIARGGNRIPLSTYGKVRDVFIFVKTSRGWRPAMGENWPSIVSSEEPCVRGALWGEMPSPAEQEEFRAYSTEWVKDHSERTRRGIGQSLQTKAQSISHPPDWDKWPEASRQCYSNLALLREVSEQYALQWSLSAEQLAGKSVESLFEWVLLPVPQCPLGGVYSHGAIVPEIDPKCSIHGSLRSPNDPKAISVLEEALAAARVYAAKRARENPSGKTVKGGLEPVHILVRDTDKALQDLGKRLREGLEATISTSKAAFELGEPIIIQYEMKNSGQQTRTVCFKKAEPLPDKLMPKPWHEPEAVREIQRKLATGGVVWQLSITVDGQGPLDPRAGLVVTAHAEMPPPNREDFVTLAPSESYRCTLNLLDYDFVGRFSTPGQYSVYIDYENWYGGEQFGLEVWHSSTGQAVHSNRAHFAIRRSVLERETEHSQEERRRQP